MFATAGRKKGTAGSTRPRQTSFAKWPTSSPLTRLPGRTPQCGNTDVPLLKDGRGNRRSCGLTCELQKEQVPGVSKFGVSYGSLNRKEQVPGCEWSASQSPPRLPG